jgi:DNA invertase Pin-like site-specific DNA recombinase
MLVVETIGRARREHLVKGKSIKEIARDLKISRNTVRKILRSGRHRFPTSEKFSLGHGSVGGRPISIGC